MGKHKECLESIEILTEEDLIDAPLESANLSSGLANIDDA